MTHSSTPLLTGEAFEERPGHTDYRIGLSGRDGAGRFALVDGVGMRRLREAGARGLFLVNDGQGREYVSLVRFPTRQPITAARCVLGDPRGARVEYLSGDRLDLRRCNLRVRTYEGVGDCRAAQVAQ